MTDPTPLRALEGGTAWPEGVPDELRRFLEGALAEDDRIVIIAVRRTMDSGGAGCVISACCDGRERSRVSWLEMLGALHKKLTDWTRDTGGRPV